MIGLDKRDIDIITASLKSVRGRTSQFHSALTNMLIEKVQTGVLKVDMMEIQMITTALHWRVLYMSDLEAQEGMVEVKELAETFLKVEAQARKQITDVIYGGR
ncbi:hypothetical protein [Alkalicoccus luteus]|uniref:Uncharacterized protein n=1 Tax=Alkalicoccus luteus TaxID=1237094 RepID=A0A969TUN9_9BACI|nr:hypothetical protein [Alkalicoccus luteus]NJP37161.1 hypothetical protein [Alkalicoccus luteus]